MKDIIIFKKQRELGTIITDTFKFIRQQWKPFFGLFFRIAGPALLLMVLGFVFYMQTTMGSLGALNTNPLLFQSAEFGLTLLLSLAVIILSGIAFYGLMYGTVMYSIKSYIDNEGIIEKTEVINGVKQNFWKLMGAGFLTSIITALGFILCILPGIYFGTVFITIYGIIVFERKSVTDALSYCFDLIKGEWWNTFATLFVVFLLYYFIMMIGQIPQYIYFFAKAFTIAETMSGDPSQLFDWGYIVINAISMIFQYVLYTIIAITSAFIYFNLNEKKNYTGTIETIESLGERDTLS